MNYFYDNIYIYFIHIISDLCNSQPQCSNVNVQLRLQQIVASRYIHYFAVMYLENTEIRDSEYHSAYLNKWPCEIQGISTYIEL